MGKKHKDIYVIELRCNWGWIKQENVYTSYEQAEEVCDNLGLEHNQYRIIKCKRNKNKKLQKFLQNLCTFMKVYDIM